MNYWAHFEHFLLYHLVPLVLIGSLIFGLIGFLLFLERRGVKTYSSGAVRPPNRWEKQRAKKLLKNRRRKPSRQRA